MHRCKARNRKMIPRRWIRVKNLLSQSLPHEFLSRQPKSKSPLLRQSLKRPVQIRLLRRVRVPSHRQARSMKQVDYFEIDGNVQRVLPQKSRPNQSRLLLQATKILCKNRFDKASCWNAWLRLISSRVNWKRGMINQRLSCSIQFRLSRPSRSQRTRRSLLNSQWRSMAN